jgi:glycosyltransferase involved in cell wall biosynthesis
MSQAAPRHAPAIASPARSICIITENEGFGGMEVHTIGLMEALIARGYRIELVVNRYDRYDPIVADRGWSDRVRIVHTDLPGILYGSGDDPNGWRKVLGGLDSSTLIFPKGDNNYGQPGFLRECRRAFQRIVFIEHLEARERPPLWEGRPFASTPHLSLWWHKRRIASRRGAAYADAIVTVSDKVRARLVEDIGYQPGKLTVVRNGVPWREFRRNESVGRAVRDTYGIRHDAFIFGMLTRLTPAKGVDTALAALRRVNTAHPDRPFVLLIAGEGYESDRLKALAQTLGVADRVRFVGFVDRPDHLVSAYDVILFSSRVEGLPLGLLQGMAAGCLPIVTRISGMPEAVHSPEVGWVVPPENPDALAEAMSSALCLDAHSTAAMRQRVLRRIQEHFDVDRAYARLIEICES